MQAATIYTREAIIYAPEASYKQEAGIYTRDTEIYTREAVIYTREAKSENLEERIATSANTRYPGEIRVEPRPGTRKRLTP